jgi:hypothetical protein
MDGYPIPVDWPAEADLVGQFYISSVNLKTCPLITRNNNRYIMFRSCAPVRVQRSGNQVYLDIWRSKNFNRVSPMAIQHQRCLYPGKCCRASTSHCLWEFGHKRRSSPNNQSWLPAGQRDHTDTAFSQQGMFYRPYRGAGVSDGRRVWKRFVIDDDGLPTLGVDPPLPSAGSAT